MDYRDRNLNHQSFQKQALSNANFSRSDLRGANFQEANLEEANFSGVKTGKSEQFTWQLFLLILCIFVSMLLGFMSWGVSHTSFGCGASRFDPNMWIVNLPAWIAAFATAGAASRGWIFRIYMGAIVCAVAMSVMPMINMVILPIWLLIALVLAIAGISAGYRYGSVAIGGVWMAVAVSSATSAAYSVISLKSVSQGVVYGILTLLIAALATHAFHRHFMRVWQTRHTSFRGANLQDAKFRNALVENCDFRDANLEGVDWDGAVIKNCQFSPTWKSVEIWHQEGWQDIESASLN
ncbi:pentapeptide repeat-containing protein [Tumidithrix elongata RA019]|uniref:Pentapeptide repeat-containing protein n=1 Tax=Tumidithrix elongata BACA0141 TaxID=2716417 RepID=A0AAW9Q754_9CYAN|nr:pentapeptide repeat-containing protein [Tumidithrix elongata RA019]